MPILHNSPVQGNNRINLLISIFTAVMVTFLAMAAFVLSFEALRELAELAIAPHLAFLFPLVVDGFIIVASLAVLRAGLARELTIYPWLLVALFSLLSIWFNVAHAPTDPLARLISAVPPIALLLAFELLMAQIKTEVKRSNTISSRQELQQLLQTEQQQLSKLQLAQDESKKEINRLSQKRETLIKDISALQSDKRTLKKAQKGQTNSGFISGNLETLAEARNAKQERIKNRREKVVFYWNQGVTSEVDIAHNLKTEHGIQVSPKTIYRDLKELELKGQTQSTSDTDNQSNAEPKSASSRLPTVKQNPQLRFNNGNTVKEVA